LQWFFCSSYAYRDIYFGSRPKGHYYQYRGVRETHDFIPAITFLHGSMGNFKGYTWVWKRFADKHGFVVLAPTFGAGSWDDKDGVEAVELVKRVLKAREYYDSHPGSVFICTGGPTVGKVSEAKMMEKVLLSHGFSREDVMLEEKATSTRQNAELTAKLIAGMDFEKVVVVSKKSHLPAALSHFHSQPGMEKVEGIASDVTEEEIITQMEEYLKTHKSERVRMRLNLLRAGKHGID